MFIVGQGEGHLKLLVAECPTMKGTASVMRRGDVIYASKEVALKMLQAVVCGNINEMMENVAIIEPKESDN